MGATRNGARSYLDVIQRACRLSRLPGFANGLRTILGPAEYAELIAVWEPFCAVVDGLIAADNWFNKKDAGSPSPEGGEDTEVA